MAQPLVPRLRPFLSKTILSPTLASNELVNAHACKDKLLHLGFGQSPFPVHPSLTRQTTHDPFRLNHYEHTSGASTLKEKIASFYESKHGLNMSEYDVIVCPGSKLGLFALQAAIEGSTLLPIPSWVSYEPQSTCFQLFINVLRIDPTQMQEAIDDAQKRGISPPTKLIINSPNNPTGLLLSNPEDVARFAKANNIIVISDEIYDGVTPNGQWRSFAPLAPENTVITTGLSKAFSLGGWRMGVLLVPKSMEGLAQALCVIASETWSSVASPMQDIACSAFSLKSFDLQQYLIDCANIHHAIGAWFSDILKVADIDCPRHQGAFYLYPCFDRYRSMLQDRGIYSVDDLASALETLSLRLALCDYDGASVMERYLQDGRRLTPDAIEKVAPRMAQAATALANFIA
eukprot:gene5696-8990_t